MPSNQIAGRLPGGEAEQRIPVFMLHALRCSRQTGNRRAAAEARIDEPS